MRILFIIIVLGALGYLGWVYREELSGRIESVTGAETTPAPETDVPPAPAAPPAGEPAAPAATPMPKEMAPAGSFYVQERVSVEVPDGIKALNAGELVKMVYRNKDGTARVTTGKTEVTIKESMLTSDPAEIKR
jgi:hypothetical protein